MTAPRQFVVALSLCAVAVLAGCAGPVIVMPWAVNHDDDNAPRVIYFERDAYKVDDSYRPVLEAHARRLKASPNLRLLIQASTDRVGPMDYNLALSRKRAETVMRQLVALGVAPERLDISSLGEARPARKPAHESSASARRVELIDR